MHSQGEIFNKSMDLLNESQRLIFIDEEGNLLSIGIFSELMVFKRIESSDGSGSRIFDPGPVGSNFCCSGRGSSAIFGLGLEIFP